VRTSLVTAKDRKTDINSRMQVMHQPKNILRTLVSFASRDGIPSLWTGLTGSWLRQCSYSTARFGLYNYFAKEVKQRTGTPKLTAGWEVVCSGVAGGAAGLIGNPTEVVLVRMCADGAKTAAERYNYGNSLRALYRIAKEEGMSTFSRGLTPNIVRSVIMSKFYPLGRISLPITNSIQTSLKSLRKFLIQRYLVSKTNRYQLLNRKGLPPLKPQSRPQRRHLHPLPRFAPRWNRRNHSMRTRRRTQKSCPKCPHRKWRKTQCRQDLRRVVQEGRYQFPHERMVACVA
jgi:hypothetical protein